METNIKYTEVINEIAAIKKLINTKNNEIAKSTNKVNPILKNINSKYLSTAIEGVLLSLPSTAIGSITYSKKLNNQANLYNAQQFNKIIRFITFIEDSEKVYNDSYLALSKKYLSRPIKKDAEELITQHKLIYSEYKLMDVLCNGILVDKVMFNKIYNNLEDKGIFLTKYEKINMEYLSSIARNIEQVVDQLNDINDSLIEVNEHLWQINDSIYSINDGISSMSDTLKEIDGGIKAGNFLNAIQTYQLYKINKNRKGLNN